MRRSFLFAFSAFILAAAGIFHPAGIVQADAIRVTVPPDFALIDSAPGVDLYRKDYSGGTPDYVLIVDLSKKAGVQLLQGAASGSGTDGTYSRQSLQQFWDSFSAADPQAACVVNGAFFSTDNDPTALAFPLKVDGKILTQGYGQSEFPGQQRMLELWADHARISALSADTLAVSNAPNILGGLSEDADKEAAALTGRTMVGLQDADGNGSLETLLFISTKTSRAADAAGVLRSFGAEDVMMLDGGDSAQMLCHNSPAVYSDRSIPQVIGITAGEQAAYDMRVVRQTDWSIVVKNRALDVALTLTNSGSETWHAGEVYLRNSRNPWGASDRLDLTADIPPGGKAAFGWTTPPFKNVGVFTSQWELVRGDKPFSEKPILINVIVIPPELADKQAELEAKLREWAQQQVDDLEKRIMDWIQSQVRQGIRTICPLSAALPGVVIAGGLWKVLRRKNE